MSRRLPSEIASLITLSTMMLFAGLYVPCRSDAPLWAAMRVAFVLIYGLFKLIACPSQTTIVPQNAIRTQEA
jgi:hypothetical protein